MTKKSITDNHILDKDGKVVRVEKSDGKHWEAVKRLQSKDHPIYKAMKEYQDND